MQTPNDLATAIRSEPAGLDASTIDAICNALPPEWPEPGDDEQMLLTSAPDGYGGRLRFILVRLPHSWRVEGGDGGGEVVWTSLAVSA